jgi:predicted anti-sigma-YlaC factor YlaD
LYSCEDLRVELSNLLDEDTASGVREQIERHLAECRTCQVLVDSTRKTLTIVTEAGRFELPTGLSDRLTATIMEKVRGGGS